MDATAPRNETHCECSKLPAPRGEQRHHDAGAPPPCPPILPLLLAGRVAPFSGFPFGTSPSLAPLFRDPAPREARVQRPSPRVRRRPLRPRLRGPPVTPPPRPPLPFSSSAAASSC